MNSFPVNFCRAAFHALAIVALLVLFAAIPAEAQNTKAVPPPVAVQVSAVPIEAFDPRDTARRRFGALDYRGGVVLSSSNKDFGGISGLRLAPDGTSFFAVIDKGRWLKGRITYDGAAPSGMADVTMAPVLGPDGQPLSRRGWFDTESIAADGDTLYVGIERVNRIVRFDAKAVLTAGITARGQPLDAPQIGNLLNNKGLEALAFVPRGLPLGGTLVALSESTLDADGNILAFLIGGPSPGAFAVKRSADYDISDAATLPGGDILILERKFSWVSGVAIRIRRLALAGLKPGATVDGPVIFEADFAYQIDNMEALAVHRARDGALVLTLISDDNFSPIQRTLLLQFTLRDE